MEIEKLIRDGKVAVITSPGFGAGWSTWNDPADFFLFDRQIAEAVLAENFDAVRARVEAVLGSEPYLGGLRDGLKVTWVQQGAPFYIHEYDGNEWVVTDFQTA